LKGLLVRGGEGRKRERRGLREREKREEEEMGKRAGPQGFT